MLISSSFLKQIFWRKKTISSGRLLRIALIPVQRFLNGFAIILNKINIKLTLLYKGTAFLGWQKTRAGPSIEHHLEHALQTLLGEKVILQAASRTDAGVHAQGQIVNFHSSYIPNQIALNKLLPEEIRVKKMTHTADSFHPTIDATGKEYHYLITNHSFQLPFDRDYAWHFPYSLNLELMKEASKKLIGTHDFSLFCNWSLSNPENKTRVLTQIIIHSTQYGFRFEIKGHSFLYKMVRNLVGHLAYIGAGKLNRMTAPAHGLTLKRVYY